MILPKIQILQSYLLKIYTNTSYRFFFKLFLLNYWSSSVSRLLLLLKASWWLYLKGNDVEQKPYSCATLSSFHFFFLPILTPLFCLLLPFQRTQISKCSWLLKYLSLVWPAPWVPRSGVGVNNAKALDGTFIMALILTQSLSLQHD